MKQVTCPGCKRTQARPEHYEFVQGAHGVFVCGGCGHKFNVDISPKEFEYYEAGWNAALIRVQTLVLEDS